MDESKRCGYCKDAMLPDKDYLICGSCNCSVHLHCLKRHGTPGDLFGDIFFDFICIRCSSCGLEVYKRQKLPWVLIITLAIYNLSLKSKGLGRNGFFHWRCHITTFIDKHWDILFDSSVKRKKKWSGTVSGALSHNSPDLFISGQKLFSEPGWWKLAHNQKPIFYKKLYDQTAIIRQQIRNNTKLNTSVVIDDEEPTDEDYTCSRALSHVGRLPKNMGTSPLIFTTEKTLSKFLEKSFTNDSLDMDDFSAVAIPHFKDPIVNFIPDNVDICEFWNWNLPTLDLELDIEKYLLAFTNFQKKLLDFVGNRHPDIFAKKLTLYFAQTSSRG